VSAAGRPSLDAAGLPVGYPFHAELEVTPREVKRLLDDPGLGVVLIDCRTKAEWQTAKIEGARLIPLDELASRVGEIEAEEGPVVVHCHHGGRSMKAALFLRQRGIEAKSMAGGIELWALDVDPRVPRY
jgi:rhodanese-related sulfurtransferase